MPTYLCFDASSAAKRYVNEPGSLTVDALFASQQPYLLTYLGYVETANILHRFKNRGLINMTQFVQARAKLRNEFLNLAAPGLLSISDDALLESIPLADKHNLNASDAAILLVYREYARAVDDPCVLVASDLRLVRAAQAEGITCLNPEMIAPADVAAFLAAATKTL